MTREKIVHLNMHQHVYKLGRLPVTALSQLVQRLEKTLGVKYVAIGTFIDTEGPFESSAEIITGRR